MEGRRREILQQRLQTEEGGFSRHSERKRVVSQETLKGGGGGKEEGSWMDILKWVERVMDRGE